jgi:hypothetical protein
VEWELVGAPLMAAAGGSVEGGYGERKGRETVGDWGGALMVEWWRRTGAGRSGMARRRRGRRRGRGEEGVAGGRGRPRQVGPTCRWLREREREGRRVMAGRVGRKRELGRDWEKKGGGGEVGRGVGLGRRWVWVR